MVLIFKERPAIGTISIIGNEDIISEELLDNLKQIGFAEGRVFLQAQLDMVEAEMQRQYYSFGKYAAEITSTVTPLDNNRVAIKIDVSEGIVAKIKKINIVGNTIFDEKDLLSDILTLNDLETESVRLSASTISQLFKDTNYNLDDVRTKKLVPIKKFL